MHQQSVRLQKHYQVQKLEFEPRDANRRLVTALWNIILAYHLWGGEVGRTIAICKLQTERHEGMERHWSVNQCDDLPKGNSAIKESVNMACT